MKGVVPATIPSSHALSESVPVSAELAALLPPDWSLDFPLARIRTCGTLTIEVLRDRHSGPDGSVQAVYGPPEPELLAIKGMSTAILLLALLASQPDGLASKDFLIQTLPSLRPTHTEASEEREEDASLKRLDNVVSLLRTLLSPPRLRAFPGASKLRKQLVRLVRATAESGPGYQLAAYPLIWLDVAALETHVTHARYVENRGEDGLEQWQAAYQIGMRGPFLSHEPYSEWATWRRGRVADLLWQSVMAQCQRAASWEEEANGREVAIRLLLAFWQAHVTNEDAFRSLIELLGKQERFQQAEECYAQLCVALEQEGRLPQKRTQEAMEVVRTLRDRGQRSVLASAASDAQGSRDPSERQHSVERPMPDIQHLLGRETWLSSVRQMVQGFPAKKLIILQGPIGVGKSSELVRLANAFQHAEPPYPRVIWLPLPAAEGSSGPEATLDLCLSTLLNECGLAPHQREAPRERLITAFLAHLKQQSRPTVMLLDNAESMLAENGELSPCWEGFLSQFVRSRHQATFLLATKEWHGWPGRESFFIAETFVPPLTTQECVRFLQRLGLGEVPIEILETVGARMAGIPLLLEWAIKLVTDPLLLDDWAGFDEREAILQADTDAENMAERLQRLLDDPSLLGEHLASRLMPLLQRILEKHLSEEARLLLTRLAIAAVPLGKPALQILCPRPRLLKELRDVSFLTAYTNRVQLLPVVSLTVQRQLSAEQRRTMQELAIQAYTRWLDEGHLEMQEAGSVVTELVVLLLTHCRLLEAAEWLLDHGWICFQRGHMQRLARLVQAALDTSDWRATPQTECGGLLLYYHVLPYIGLKIDEKEQARTHQQILDAVLAERVAVEPLMEAYLVHILMRYQMSHDRFEEAQQLLENCFQRLEALFRTDFELHAMLLFRKAWLLNKWSGWVQEQGRSDEAKSKQEQTIKIYQQCISLLQCEEKESAIGALRKHTLKKKLASFLNNLSYQLNRLGSFAEALKVVEESISLKEQGFSDFGTLAAAYGEKSQILAAFGRFREALFFDEKARKEVQRCADFGDTMSQEERWIYQINQGRLALRLGQIGKAEQLLVDALPHVAARRKIYGLFAKEALMEIEHIRRSSHPYQLDWRWIERYRELDAYDAYWWWTPAGLFTEEEQRQWDALSKGHLDDERKSTLAALLIGTRNREVEAALREQREPHFHYPALDIAEVRRRIAGFLQLRLEIEQEEPNAVVRRLYGGTIEDELAYIRTLEATYEGESQHFWELNRELNPPPTPEEMEYALSRLKQVLLLGLQRGETREISEHLLSLLQEQFHLFLSFSPESKPVQSLGNEDSNVLSSLPDQGKALSVEAAKRFFEAIFQEADLDDWHVLIDTSANGVRIDSAMRSLFLPDTPLSLETVRDCFFHEVLGHVSRSAAGERSALGLLGINTKGYSPTEEGLTQYYERLLSERKGQVFDDAGSWIGGLAVGLASGVMTPPQTFTSLYAFFVPFILLSRLLWKYDEKGAMAEKRAQNRALARCLRTFRGVPDLNVAGICNTRDVVYLRGRLKIERAIAQDKTVLDRLAVGKIALELLPDLQELGITATSLLSLQKRASDPNLDSFILSFETQIQMEGR
jgi:hypothetical protein